MERFLTYFAVPLGLLVVGMLFWGAIQFDPALGQLGNTLLTLGTVTYGVWLGGHIALSQYIKRQRNEDEDK